MRPQPETIRLGAHEWRVRPLTLAQVQSIEPILIATQEQKGNVASAIAIVAIALSRDHVEASEGLMDIEATAPDIAVAMTSVLRLGGFIETGSEAADPLGEPEAGAI